MTASGVDAASYEAALQLGREIVEAEAELLASGWGGYLVHLSESGGESG